MTRPLALDLALALVGIPLPNPRDLVSTALQLGIAGGVGLMLVMQTKIAARDDQVRAQRPRAAAC